MSNPKEEFYRVLNEIIGNERLTNEEAYIINDYVSSLEATYKKQQKEIERLNNIIVIMEKYINEVNNMITTENIKENMYICGRYDENLDILDKLNKLKGDNK